MNDNRTDCIARAGRRGGDPARPAGERRRHALGIEYDGSGFCGWQSQPEGCSVQDALERAVSGIAGEQVRVVGAGRTDAGVHATGQVAHFDTSVVRQPSAWVRGVNALLPPAVAVRWVRAVPPGFHARHSAHSRTYRYLLLNRAQRPGIYARYVGWHHVPLDLAAMREAAAHLVGTRDFDVFRAASCQSRSTERNLMGIDIGRAGEMLVLTFKANAYLHHMVRNMVAALVHVGRGKRPPGWIPGLMEGKDRRERPPTFSACGLYLTHVEYNRGLGLPREEAPVPILEAAPRE